MMGKQQKFKEVPLGAVQAFSETSGNALEVYLPNKSATGNAVLYSGCESGTSGIDYRRLQDVGVQTMLIAVEDLASCEEALERELGNLMLDPTVEPQKKAMCAQQVGVNVARDMLCGGNPAADVDRASGLFDSLLTGMLADPAVATSLLAMSAHHRSTASHLFAVSVLSMMLAQEAFGGNEKQMHDVALAGMLHDLGKTSIDPAILNKVEPLTADEINLIRQHPVESIRLLGGDATVGVNICRMILEHHERYDGMGYPVGVAGEDISIGGRILAITDSFHAMIGRRDYRTALTPVEAMRVMRSQVGKQFDPNLFAAWERVLAGGVVSEFKPVLLNDDTDEVGTGYHADHRKSKKKPPVSRRSDRKAVYGQIQMACIATGTLHREYVARELATYPVVDLSRAGACLESIVPMYRGEVVSVRLNVGDSPQWVRGVVRWCRRNSSSEFGYRMGVQFMHRLAPEEAHSRHPVVAMMSNQNALMPAS